MNSRFRKLAVESLEGRSVLSTMVEADFNHDGYQDIAALTGPNTITVSLFDPSDNGYDVSAILTTPKNQPIGGFNVDDYNGDGNLDISTGGLANNRFYSLNWFGNGDGTFSNRDIQKSGRIRPGW
jgi:hypothetical protein